MLVLDFNECMHHLSRESSVFEDGGWSCVEKGIRLSLTVKGRKVG